MEAVPKLPMISFELKVSSEHTHFGPKLKQYIAEAYREDPDSYGNEIHQLEGLRSTAVRPSIDSSGLNTMIRYFCQLRAMQSRFPMAKGQPVACTFSWKDVYANMPCQLADIRFEMACILYNIGAIHTQLAASEPRTTPDSLKASCTHYQNAAWAFMYLREHYPQPPGVDVSTDIMRLLQEICFAQAQECILDKSIQDTRKPSVVGAVATQVQYFYRNSLAMLGPSTGSDNIHEIIGTKLYNYWHRYLSFKQSYIGCVVCLYQGLNAEEQQKFGERVAFYQLAVDKLNEARKLAKYIEPTPITNEAITFTNDVVEGKRKAAKNENEFIYHEEVPDKDLLADFKPVCLVKPLPINFNDPEISGPDIFSRLVPIGAHEASSVYSEEKAKLLRQVGAQIDSKNTELTEFMSSLQLDQLEVLDSDQKIPQEIVDRCAAMNAKSDVIPSLVDSMNSLAEIITDVEHALGEIKELIQEETQSEKDYQKVMGPRPPSIVQTELSREYHKYQEAHARTNESNQVLHKAMTLHIANLRLLAQPLDVLGSKIPCIENIEGLDRATMSEMRRVVGKAREMQAQRSSLLRKLRDALTADDITARLLARPNDPPDRVFAEELEKHTPTVKIIEQNLAAQENIINRLTALYAEYGDSRRLLTEVLRKREALINALVTSYDSYAELLGKSQKGLEFYRKLRGSLRALSQRLRAACQVQQEERQEAHSHLARKAGKAAAPPVPTTSAATPELPPAPPVGGSMKLKDYLPYMKNRGARNNTPQVQVEPVVNDTYYPEAIYPGAIRPAPVGSEADPTQLPDGVMPGMANPYARYGSPMLPAEAEPYAAPSYAYPATSKAFDKPDDNYGYTAYTPQFSTPIADPQYSNPYYSSTQNNAMVVTDSQSMPYGNVNVPNSQYNPYDPYGAHGTQMANVPEQLPTMSTYNPGNQVNADLTNSFAQMNVGNVPKPDVPMQYPNDYYQNFYSNYPMSTSNVPTYSHAAQNSNTTTAPAQVPSDYAALQYPYTNDSAAQFVGTSQAATSYDLAQNTTNIYLPGQSNANPVSNAYSLSDPQYSYGQHYDQGYTIYTNTESATTSTTNMMNVPAPSSVSHPPLPNDQASGQTNMVQFDAIDQPIKSHVTGEALTYQGYQNYDRPAMNFSNTDSNVNYNQNEANFPNNPQNFQVAVSTYGDQSTTYSQSYQNHPGYSYNLQSGSYDYNYGSQNSYANTQQMAQQQAWPAHGTYTSAGACETVQSPSEQVAVTPDNSQPKDQTYYNAPYGYITHTNQSNTVAQDPAGVPTNYGADVNQSTYMQSGQRGVSVTCTSKQDQVSSPVENATEPNFNQNTEAANDQTPNVANDPTPSVTKEVEKPVKVEKTASTDTLVPESKPEPSAFDLLLDIDFSVEQKPLMPEIKVPQVSESAIAKRPVALKVEENVKPKIKEEVIERPAKIDLFTDAILMNKFTQEVKKLQQLTESLTNRAAGGLTVLDAKWKLFQDTQQKEKSVRSTSIGTEHSIGNALTEVIPFDDSRVTLASDPDAYINATHYKQLAPWCIPLIISKTPAEEEFVVFWKAVLENKITCMVCLLSEIEMQGSTYWPTGIGQPLELDGVTVSLEEVVCTVHWTERRLAVAAGPTVFHVTHYQINVYPAKMVCSPLVLLADKVLSSTYAGQNPLRGAWVQCAAGGGRSAGFALLLAAECQLRAGQVELCNMLDAACIKLCKHRTNVLEDTKYLADAYRTVLFYAQGVLCSGTTMFNGEAVTVPAASLPSPTQPTATANNQKVQKFSRESFEEMKQSPGLKSGDMKDPLNFLDPLWSLKKK